MPNRTSATGSELFIVDNSDEDWKVARYLHDWCQISKSIDIATGYLEIGALLTLKDEWQKVDKIRILMGDEVSKRTKDAFAKGLEQIKERLDNSIEKEKDKNDFLAGVPAIVEAIRAGKIECRVYRKDKFHAKAYITHGRLEVVGASALVGSSNFTYPGLTENIELNVQITGRPVTVLQEWFDEHWKDAEDVSAELLQVIERHVKEYSPFEVYAKALQEYFRGHELTANEWERGQGAKGSKVYPLLDQYQKDGYHALLKIAETYRGAFLCDGVGLGKTFVGLMLIERFIVQERKNVCLLVPKAANEPVWQAVIERYLPDIGGVFGNRLVVLNHTDLTRNAGEKDYPRIVKEVMQDADVILIDEAHHFRNPGTAGTGEVAKPSRYRKLFDICDGKRMFFLTATPVNNRLIDLQHMMELFARDRSDYFKDAPLGIHSLRGHFRTLEKALEEIVEEKDHPKNDGVETNMAEATQVLASDRLFQTLVVQRSRAYVKESQKGQGAGIAMFPEREAPRVQPYSVQLTYGRLLTMLDKAFGKDKPLFSLAIYYPLAFYKGSRADVNPLEEGRQKQVVGLIRTGFLKRFESSARAFDISCQRLLITLLKWITKHAQTSHEKTNLDRWRQLHGDLIERVHKQQHALFEDNQEVDEDLISEEMLEGVEERGRDEYDVPAILAECYNDLGQLVEFFHELRKCNPAQDDKLRSLIHLLKSDTVLKNNKVLIFSEYADTARYLKEQLKAADIDGVEEIDSGNASGRKRFEVIRQFAPYYNGSTSTHLREQGLTETRVLISTDVLSEGLNLQDATRLINYDLHWNPVRLMQRIGRVDRRMNPQTEAILLADHPEQRELRGKIVYWNFLPPKELESLLRLYSRVSHKTLRISKTLGIEGGKLLRPDDDFEALRNFNTSYEGEPSVLEQMHLTYQQLLRENPELAAQLDALPGRVFSGKENLKPGTAAVFFCYALPAPSAPQKDLATGDALLWTEDAGQTRWLMYDVATGAISEAAPAILPHIRSTPETPRKTALDQVTLSEIRAKVEKHIKNSYLKAAQAPAGVKPVLKAWMELC